MRYLRIAVVAAAAVLGASTIGSQAAELNVPPHWAHRVHHPHWVWHHYLWHANWYPQYGYWRHPYLTWSWHRWGRYAWEG
jgi:Spy/CpxP family protein refolding chaperone